MRGFLRRIFGGGARASTSFGGVTDLQNPALGLSDWALGRTTASG